MEESHYPFAGRFIFDCFDRKNTARLMAEKLSILSNKHAEDILNLMSTAAQDYSLRLYREIRMTDVPEDTRKNSDFNQFVWEYSNLIVNHIIRTMKNLVDSQMLYFVIMSILLEQE